MVDGANKYHKHSYNAISGVAIIIGKAARKLLHIGVHNKSCTACAHNTTSVAIVLDFTSKLFGFLLINI